MFKHVFDVKCVCVCDALNCYLGPTARQEVKENDLFTESAQIENELKDGADEFCHYAV